MKSAVSKVVEHFIQVVGTAKSQKKVLADFVPTSAAQYFDQYVPTAAAQYFDHYISTAAAQCFDQ